MRARSLGGQRIAILGAGAGGLASVAHLMARGHDVALYDLPEFAEALAPVREGGIHVFGALPEAHYHPPLVTTDIGEALHDARLIFLVAPAYGHARFVDLLAPWLRDDHILVLNPGGVGGALEIAHTLKIRPHGSLPLIAESANLVYAVNKATPSPQHGPVDVRINGVKTQVPVAAFPARRTRDLLVTLGAVVPEFVGARDVLETSLQNINIVLHPALFLSNLSRVEGAEDWGLFRSGLTRAVASLIEAIDEERLSTLRALELPETSLAQWIARYSSETTPRCTAK